jgi:hypothetical protein
MAPSPFARAAFPSPSISTLPVASAAPAQEAAAFAAHPRHLDIINVAPAWEKTKGIPSVVSAITDTGAELAHLQLRRYGSAAVLHDPFGHALDGNKDGVGGDDMVFKFSRI